MSLPVQLSVFAAADLRALHAFHGESQRSGAHLRLLQLDITLDRLIRRIQEFPRAYPPWRGDVRRIIAPRFFLAVYYVVLSDRIVILALADQRQDPRRLRFTAR